MTGSGNFGHPTNYQSDAKRKPSRDLVARVFPRFKLFACYYSGHLLTQVIFCCVFVGCWDCKSFWFKCALWWASKPEIKMYSQYLLVIHRNSELWSGQESIIYWQSIFISKPKEVETVQSRLGYSSETQNAAKLISSYALVHEGVDIWFLEHTFPLRSRWCWIQTLNILPSTIN